MTLILEYTASEALFHEQSAFWYRGRLLLKTRAFLLQRADFEMVEPVKSTVNIHMYIVVWELNLDHLWNRFTFWPNMSETLRPAVADCSTGSCTVMGWVSILGYFLPCVHCFRDRLPTPVTLQKTSRDGWMDLSCMKEWLHQSTPFRSTFIIPSKHQENANREKSWKMLYVKCYML